MGGVNERVSVIHYRGVSCPLFIGASHLLFVWSLSFWVVCIHHHGRWSSLFVFRMHLVGS